MRVRVTILEKCNFYSGINFIFIVFLGPVVSNKFVVLFARLVQNNFGPVSWNLKSGRGVT